MSKIKLTGDTSGYIEISAPNVAANNTLELGGGTKILTNLDNVFTGVTTYSGNIDLNANLDLDDNNKILLGTGDDLQVYHDGTHSHIREVGTGDLRLRSSKIQLMNENSQEYFVGTSGGSVELFHSDVKKFETTTTGATVTGTLVSDSVTSELDLSAISSSISDTAVDVFVYDTRKDSDGGAWRKRTQHTSWYNETLNTSTRGSRKEFPAVAVIVCFTSYIKIYDGDDPDLPLWMEIRGTTSRRDQGWLHTASVKAASALNGIIALATYGNGVDSGGTHIVDFIKDDLRRHSSSGGRSGDGLIITQRGTSVNLNVSTSLGLVVSELQNDVAMTVLPNAPIDDATGLPVPTIAVATDGGVSTIKDDGTVASSAGDAAGLVEYLDNNYILITRDNNTGYFAVHNNHFTSGSWNANANSYYSATIPTFNQSGYINGLAASENGYFGNNIGVHIYDALSSSATNTNGLFSNITTSYNTGYMHGDIKGAFLSDTDTTNATVGSAHYTETFTGSGDNTWGLAGGATISGGVLTLANLQDSRATDLTAASSLTTGQKYIAEIEIVSNTSQVFKLDDDGAGAGVGGNTNYGFCGSGKTGTFLIGFTKTASPRMRLIRVSGGPATITSFKIYTAEEQDRSVNNNGLKVFGTVTKSAVATGADLVAYSGFSASNHLAQPYNSDLNPGSGTYSVVAWFKTESNNSGEGAITGLGNADTDEVMIIYVASSYGIYFDYGTSTEYVYLSNSSDRSMVRDGNWHQVVCQVTAGQVGEIYIDGIKKSTAQNVAAPGTWSQWDTNYQLYVGCARGLGTLPFSGSISLVRYSLSKMSAEQIKKIYEDERVLFQENAKATLYGSSDAITALAYDEDTELLHVGTSSGRSDFQGLRRINNTTTAVTTAISASDELIAEQ